MCSLEWNSLNTVKNKTIIWRALIIIVWCNFNGFHNNKQFWYDFYNIFYSYPHSFFLQKFEK